MGMFNIVKFKRRCVKCGGDLEWQSKFLVLDDLYVLDNALREYEFNDRLSGEIHAWCNQCDLEQELYIKNGKVISKTKDFERSRIQTVTALKKSLDKVIKRKTK